MKRKVGSLAFFGALLVTVLWFSGGIIPAVYDLGKPAEAVADDSEKDVAVDESDEANVIVIDNEDYKKNRQGRVIFTHTKHARDYNVSCWECHHEYDEKINLWTPLSDTMNCLECHDPIEKQDEAVRLQTAYHLNCKGCHKKLAQEKKKTGPYRKCLKCHEKKTE